MTDDEVFYHVPPGGDHGPGQITFLTHQRRADLLDVTLPMPAASMAGYASGLWREVVKLEWTGDDRCFMQRPNAFVSPDLRVVIPPGMDRDIVRLWNEGLTSTQIGTRYARAPKTILNRITALRDQYGPEVVHYKRDRDSGHKSG